MLPAINIKLRKDRKKDGKCAIVLQVYYQNKQRQIFTGLFVEEKHFVNGEVVKHPNAAWLNASIKKKYNELEAEYLKQGLEGGISIGISKKRSSMSFFDFAIKMYNEKSNRAGKAFITRAKADIEEFRKFAGNLSFTSITPQLLKDYEQHLFSIPNNRNTVNRKFKRIKQPFAEAIKHKLTTDNPFNLFKPVTFQQPKRNFLTMDEIKLIEEADIPEGLESTRNYFLLSCYTGLRYCDLAKFDAKKSVIKNKGVERIIIGTTKTKEVVSIKLNDKLKKIISKINEPVIANTHANQYLRNICTLAGITQYVTFHMARHSFAVNSASLGIPIEAVSKLLGHQNIKTTSIYYKLTDTKIDEWMDKWETKD
jgi:site-specific recombinase XerD